MFLIVATLTGGGHARAQGDTNPIVTPMDSARLNACAKKVQSLEREIRLRHLVPRWNDELRVGNMVSSNAIRDTIVANEKAWVVEVADCCGLAPWIVAMNLEQRIPGIPNNFPPHMPSTKSEAESKQSFLSGLAKVSSFVVAIGVLVKSVSEAFND